MAIAAEGRRLHPRARPTTCARAMGKKKKEILDAEFVPFSEGMRANGYSHAAIKALWDTLVPVLRLRVQQGPHRGVRDGLLLDRVPEGQLPGRVHGGAADLGGRRQGQDGRLPQRVPPDGDPGVAARRQRVGSELHPGRRRHSLRPDGSTQRRRTTWSTGIVAAREAHGKAVNFHGFLDQVPLVVCNKRVIESLIKAGALRVDGTFPPRR